MRIAVTALTIISLLLTFGILINALRDKNLKRRLKTQLILSLAAVPISIAELTIKTVELNEKVCDPIMATVIYVGLAIYTGTKIYKIRKREKRLRLYAGEKES